MRYQSRHVEVEAMQWDGLQEPHRAELPGQYSAESIVAWVNANGGDARYEPCVNLTRYDPHHGAVRPARIAVRTINGWAYAEPGHYVVMGAAYFRQPDRSAVTANQIRDFYPCDPETFDKRWEPTPEDKR